MAADRPADRIRKLVAMAASGDTPEASSARAMARKQIAKLDTNLLSRLAGRRNRLLEDLREESHRLVSSNERATKAETGDLISSALALLGHYERLDALLAAVLLLRIEDGHALTNEERDQLVGPREDFFDQWMRAGRERRKAERERRRAERRAERRQRQEAT